MDFGICVGSSIPHRSKRGACIYMRFSSTFRHMENQPSPAPLTARWDHVTSSSQGIVTRNSMYSFFLSFSLFLQPHLQHMEVPRLGVQSELQLPAYAKATAMSVPRRRIWDLHQSSWQHQILNPLSEPRDRTWIHTETVSGS